MMKNWIVPEFQRSLIKQPSEEVRIACDFSDKVLPYFGRIVTASFSAEKWNIAHPSEKEDGDDILQQASIQIEAPYSTQARITIVGGDVEHDYHIKCLAETEDGQTFEQDFFVRVKEL
jgi:hypothetical protein